MAENAPHWSRIRERGSMWGLKLTAASIRLFGRMLSLPLVLGVVTYFFATDRAGRAASRAYLTRVRAFTRPEPEWRPTLWQSFLHYREFAFSIADRVTLWGGGPGAFSFRFDGKEHIKPHLDRGQGVLLLGAHLGSFDALRVLGEQDAVPVNVLMYTQHATKINEVFRTLSPDVDVRVIPVEPGSAATTLQIKACIDRGELVAILADRVEPGDLGRVCEVDFLGDKTRLPVAPFQLPLVLGCPAAMLVALRGKDPDYAVVAEPLVAEGERRVGSARAARAHELAQDYASFLERQCVRAPRQWFNFYDVWAKGDTP